MASKQEFRFGRGKISGTLGLFFSSLSLAAVICFHFPEVFTTPELRAVYPMAFIRMLLAVSIIAGFILSLVSFVLSRTKKFGIIGICLSLIARALGGAGVEVTGPVVSRNYVGLDWFVIDLFLVVLIFVPIERIFVRLKNQKIFRREWKTDVVHFFVSHLLIQLTSILILAPSLVLNKYIGADIIKQIVTSQPVWVQFIEIVFLADLSQYWIHRAFHKSPILWKFHAIHHSSKDMDWLASSRLHLIDIVVTRGLSLIPLFLLGFSEKPLQAYLVFVAFWATFIHTNIKYRFSLLGNFFATPFFHHWHHADEQRAIDKNFAIHFSFLDLIFGTYFLPQDGSWPANYGIAEEIPSEYVGQTLFPFRK